MRPSRGLAPAIIQLARVLDVDPTTWLMTVRTFEGRKLLKNVSVTSKYTHPMGGEGFHVMPEPGAFCWLCFPSESDAKPFPLAYFSPPGAGSQDGKRPYANPGDIIGLTRDGNGIRIRRGGVVEILATPIARTMYLPSFNEIRHICERFCIQTFGGQMVWSTARPEEDGEGEGRKATSLLFEMKEYADHASPVAQILAGHIKDGEPQAFFIKVFESGDTDSPVEAVSILLGKDGSVQVTCGDVSYKLSSGKSFRIFNTDGKDQPMVLGTSLLTDLKAAMDGAYVVLQAAAAMTGTTASLEAWVEMQAKLGLALTDKAPYLSEISSTE